MGAALLRPALPEAVQLQAVPPPLPGSGDPLLLAYRGKTDGDIMVTGEDRVQVRAKLCALG